MDIEAAETKIKDLRTHYMDSMNEIKKDYNAGIITPHQMRARMAECGWEFTRVMERVDA